MFLNRRITIGPNFAISAVASSSLSVMPNRNGPWIRRMVTYGGTCLSCRMCGRPSSMYSGVTGDTLVVSVTR